ncbi:MAG: glycine cleavage system protein [Symbiobacteriaceae bacterium]|jgi:glycine cleavage system H protein|nr:glycine cleavage system protein [Symbiobacteriaceae bacterium]
MANVPAGLRYSKEHEWIKVEGNVGTIGITDFAQHQLGDVVFVELPPVGRVLKAHEQFGVVESVKTVSDLYTPVAGKVVAVNEALEGAPETVNTSAYEDGWIVKIELSNPGDLDALLDAAAYEAHIKED